MIPFLTSIYRVIGFGIIIAQTAEKIRHISESAIAGFETGGFERAGRAGLP